MLKESSNRKYNEGKNHFDMPAHYFVRKEIMFIRETFLQILYSTLLRRNTPQVPSNVFRQIYLLKLNSRLTFASFSSPKTIAVHRFNLSDKMSELALA